MALPARPHSSNLIWGGSVPAVQLGLPRDHNHPGHLERGEHKDDLREHSMQGSAPGVPQPHSPPAGQRHPQPSAPSYPRAIAHPRQGHGAAEVVEDALRERRKEWPLLCTAGMGTRSP